MQFTYFQGQILSVKKKRFTVEVPSSQIKHIRLYWLICREFGNERYTPVYLKSVTNKDRLCSAGNSAQHPVRT